jgi:hypothetical protein
VITGTLLKASLFCLLAGAGWAVVAAAGIYLGSTFVPPRLKRGTVWAEWRRKRMIWGAALILSAVGAMLTPDPIVGRLVAEDLYWRIKGGELLVIGRLGSMTGYLAALLLFTLGAALSRRQKTEPPALPPTSNPQGPPATP